MLKYNFSFHQTMLDYIGNKNKVMKVNIRELHREDIIASLIADLTKTYDSLKLVDKKDDFSSFLHDHMRNVYNNYWFVQNIVNTQKNSFEAELCINHEQLHDFDITMKNFYKQNRKNKAIINKVKIFTIKRKLCNDVRNLIISFLIIPPCITM